MVLRHGFSEIPIILFSVHADLQANALSGFIGVDVISPIDGIPKLIDTLTGCCQAQATSPCGSRNGVPC